MEFAGQSEMQRGMAKKPNKDGKHHRSDNQILPLRTDSSSEFVTVDSSPSDILTVSVQQLCLGCREIGHQVARQLLRRSHIGDYRVYQA